MEKGWDTVAHWYDSYLEQSQDSYQEKVIAPNVLRILDPKKGQTILDLACGQGYFTRLVAGSGALVHGTDISKELIQKAKEKGDSISYTLAPAHHTTLKGASYDSIFTILAFENIKEIDEVVKEIERLLKKNGRFILVLLHPAFRIPQHSDWGFDTKRGVQYRTMTKYLSEVAIKIEQHPFKGAKKVTTVTYHRPLQWYMKLFKKHGFAMTGLEEWISHKKSQSGPRQKAEDTARKEIPLFLALELKKI